MRRKFLLYMFQDEFGAAYRDVYAQYLENLIVIGIGNACDSAPDVKPVLGNLAGHQVACILIGDSNQHISSGGANALQGSRLAAISADNYTPQILAEYVASGGVLFQDEHLMAIVKQQLGKVIADLAPSDDDDIHVFLSLIFALSKVLPPALWD
jgi:hypothetical protein